MIIACSYLFEGYHLLGLGLVKWDTMRAFLKTCLSFRNFLFLSRMHGFSFSVHIMKPNGSYHIQTMKYDAHSTIILRKKAVNVRSSHDHEMTLIIIRPYYHEYVG